MTFPITKFTKLDTPFYYYDLGNLNETLKAIHAETDHRKNFHVHYAIKANANPRIMKIIAPVSYTHLTLPTIYSV